MAADTARPNSESRTPVINDDNDIDKKKHHIYAKLGIRVQRRTMWVCFIVGVLAPDLGNREAWDSTLRREERGREEQKRREKREEEKRVEREERGRIFTPGREKEERGRQRGKTREGSRMRKCKRLQTKARGGDEWKSAL